MSYWDVKRKWEELETKKKQVEEVLNRYPSLRFTEQICINPQGPSMSIDWSPQYETRESPVDVSKLAEYIVAKLEPHPACYEGD